MLALLREFLFQKTKHGLLIVVAALSGVLLVKSATYSAETIKFNYGLLGFKVETADLELFAEEGIITDRLNFYLKRLSLEQRKRFQSFLQQTYDVNPVLVYRFSHTSVGIKMLKRLGNIVNIPEDINGFYGIRAAIINSAASPEGVNFINFLNQFPTDIKLDLDEVFDLVEKISQTERNTEKFIASLEQNNKTINNKNNIEVNSEFEESGTFKPVKETINFYDRGRDRQITTDFYFPAKLTKKVPLIVVSNGLGAERKRFAELANYLTSHGFAVAVPEHPGSNQQRQQEFIKGLHQENFDGTDFMDRPLDISFMLDELTKIDRERFNNFIDPNNVGIFGYSIGGTTALSLAGANIDYKQLAEDCKQTLDLTNISVLYQCRALEIRSREKSLQDKRIKSAFLFVPFGKSLFNTATLDKVKIPMLWQVVDKDFLTSLTKEQLPLYSLLQNSDRTLVIAENLPHSTATLSKQRSATQQNESRIARKYQNILALVFFKTYLTREEYGKYLNDNFVKAITEAPYTLHLTKEVPSINEIESN